jgi:hypothetical protein
VNDTDRDHLSTAKTARWIHEAFFSLNLAFVIMALVFDYAPRSLISHLNRLESAVNGLLQIRQTDFITGYWAFFLPGIALALCIWLLLRVLSRTQLTAEILRSGAGVAAVSAPPLWWLCTTYMRTQRYGWTPLAAFQFYELALALFCVSMYLYGRWPIPAGGSVLILLLHYAFWFWQFWPLFGTLLRGWGGAGAVTLVAGLCSSLSWVLYLANLGQESTLRQTPSKAAPPS